ncbi:3-galactosyl-N-acetylglucosaminide 4-alpha-L-fucosyltransferase FUT3-like [Haliotis asinina]|uniref:3-galactosyl-N-acetylglucosaminide 4-alpha-L-fucosyltransferase FUT3-like n=1 Tax=Haliotis asinina TaxID=109174 RepID=UPI0035324FFA
MMGRSCLRRRLPLKFITTLMVLLMASVPVYLLTHVFWLKKHVFSYGQDTEVTRRNTQTYVKSDKVSSLNEHQVQASMIKPEKPEYRNSSIRYQNKRKEHTHKLIVKHMIPKRNKHYNAHPVKCMNYTCIFSSNTSYIPEADAVIVDVFLLSRRQSKEIPVRSSPGQVWIFFAQEPWTNYRPRFPTKNWNSIFNWTLTYQRHSDFWAPYGLLRHQPGQKEPDWNKVMALKTKKVLWFASNCKTSSKREEYVDQLKKYIPIDIFGRCGKSDVNCTTGSKSDEDSCFAQYKFYLSFESTFCKDYVTEKFFKTFQRDRHIIPVVRGNGDYAKHYPKDTFLNTADFRSPKDLAAHLLYLDRNSTAYLNLLKTHAQYKYHSAGRKVCEMCIRLHRLGQHRQSYRDISGWMDTCDNFSKR